MPRASVRTAPQPARETEEIALRRVVSMLPLRLVGFAAFQTVIALGLLLRGRTDWWDASVPWWPVAAIATNLITIGVLVRFLRREDRRFRDMFSVDRARIGRDLGTVLGLAAVAAVLLIMPNFGLATVIFGDAEAPLNTMVQPLPSWIATGVAVLFPVTIALSELVAYFGYVQPRLEMLTGRASIAVGVAAGFMALQHVALPLVFDWGFIAWRGLMFLPFALFLGVVLRWRPGLLPYLAVLHGLAELQIVFMILSATL